MLRPGDRAEVEEIAASIRPLIPVYRPEFELAIEQLACRLWRRGGPTVTSPSGVVRDGQPAPVVGHLAKLEGAIAPRPRLLRPEPEGGGRAHPRMG